MYEWAAPRAGICGASTGRGPSACWPRSIATRTLATVSLAAATEPGDDPPGMALLAALTPVLAKRLVQLAALPSSSGSLASAERVRTATSHRRPEPGSAVVARLL